MTALLLVDPTEEQQTLVESLERAGFSVSTCALDEAAGRLSDGDVVDGLLLNMAGHAEEAAIAELLRDGSLPPDTATVAILSYEQAAALEPAFPIDDFVVHPATPEELATRIRRAIRRRHGPESTHLLRCGDLRIDQDTYQVFVAGRSVDLTYKEYELLRFLAQNQDKVCTREMLLSQVWGYEFYGGARTVDVHIRRLRSKLEDRGHTFIETVRNVGYRLHAN